ncbi:hypothetical protein VT73_02170 [Rathayibacter toxicus]|uniref:DDE Tnp4 domain-containing protein n=1 Tax=Rathayibacter toxicus TaxID=145458 RepID=A0A0U1PV86_9MICO|nr:hypothetical protein VT73_02170 [Rathayibacter toxicus]
MLLSSRAASPDIREVLNGTVAVGDGTLVPCWSWNAIAGNRHDRTAAEESGRGDFLDLYDTIADSSYQGTGAVTAIKKYPGQKQLDTNRETQSIRQRPPLLYRTYRNLAHIPHPTTHLHYHPKNSILHTRLSTFS